jgi:putative aldouronate transport system substrate-binding protein
LKRKNSKLVALCILLIVTILLSSSCTNKTSESSSNTENTIKNNDLTQTTSTQETEVPDPFGKYDPPITISIAHSTIDSDVKYPEGDTAEDNVWTRTYEEELGIKLDVKWAGPSTQATEKINLMISSNDIPDVLSVSSSQFMMLQEAGKLLDLKDVYEKYATPFLMEQLNSDGGFAIDSCTINDGLYAIPTYLDPKDNAIMLWVREDWRKALNLPEPKTIEDFYTIAEAFTTQDPDGNNKDDTPGFGMSGDLSVHLEPFFYAYDLYPGIPQSMSNPRSWVEDPTGKLVPGLLQDPAKMKTALLKLQEMYKEGMIAQDYAVISYEKLTELITNEKIGMIYGIYWYPTWPLGASKEKNPNAEWKAYPIPSATGTPAKVKIEKLSLRRYNVVTSSMKNPEAAIKLANLTLEKCHGEKAEPKKYISGEQGKGSAMWKYSAMYVELGSKNLKKYHAVNEAMKKNDPSKLNLDQKLLYDNLLSFKTNDDNSKWPHAAIWNLNGSYEIIDYYQRNKLFKYNEYYDAPTKAMVEKGPVLITHLYEVLNEIIMGADVNKWDDYIERFNKTGGEEMIKEVNDWYSKIK